MNLTMTLKFTQPQANSLFDLFTYEVLPEKPIDFEDKLLQMLMIKIYKKLRAKLEGKLKGQGYSIALTDEESIAFYVYFQNRDYGQNYLYEQTLIRKQILEIDKTYK